MILAIHTFLGERRFVRGSNCECTHSNESPIWDVHTSFIKIGTVHAARNTGQSVISDRKYFSKKYKL